MSGERRAGVLVERSTYDQTPALGVGNCELSVVGDDVDAGDPVPSECLECLFGGAVHRGLPFVQPDPPSRPEGARRFAAIRAR
jgi:hypothetical protein